MSRKFETQDLAASSNRLQREGESVFYRTRIVSKVTRSVSEGGKVLPRLRFG
jgi:hypothetical protein